jgi:hypothetical protein
MIELQFIEREGEAPSEPISRMAPQSAGCAMRREGEAPSEPISRMARQTAGCAMRREGEAPSEPISRMARQSAGCAMPREGEAPSEPISRMAPQSAGCARRREGEAPSEPISRAARQSAGYAMPREGEAPSEPISRAARQSSRPTSLGERRYDLKKETSTRRPDRPVAAHDRLGHGLYQGSQSLARDRRESRDSVRNLGRIICVAGRALCPDAGPRSPFRRPGAAGHPARSLGAILEISIQPNALPHWARVASESLGYQTALR